MGPATILGGAHFCKCLLCVRELSELRREGSHKDAGEHVSQRTAAYKIRGIEGECEED